MDNKTLAADAYIFFNDRRCPKCGSECVDLETWLVRTNHGLNAQAGCLDCDYNTGLMKFNTVDLVALITKAVSDEKNVNWWFRYAD